MLLESPNKNRIRASRARAESCSGETASTMLRSNDALEACDGMEVDRLVESLGEEPA